MNQQTVNQLRDQFPALSFRLPCEPGVSGPPGVGDRTAVYFDGPAGTQVPQSVIDAMGDYLKYCNANHDGAFATSRASDVLLDEAHRAVADLLGTPLDDGADCISFGPNMTTLTFALSRAIGRTWGPGDEVVVTRLDHDANVTPWVLAARDAGATVRYASFDHKDCSLNLDELRSLINKKTKLVAVGAAANVAGTVNPIAEICNCAHDAGAHVFVDAVHYVPHARTNIAAMNCDYLACSAYKFFGPHVGMMWGRRELLEQLEAYKVRPAADTLPGKWMTGTQNHEGIAGTLAAIEYLADIGRTASGPTQASGELDRRDALDAAYESIQSYERKLVTHLLAGLAQIPAVKVWGITDPAQLDKRLPTVAITHASIASGQLAQQLGERAIFTWGGNCYALQFTESLGLEPDGVVRIGLVHYNTIEEIDYLLEVLRAL